MLAPVKLGVMTKAEAEKKAKELLQRVGLPRQRECISETVVRWSETAYCNCKSSGDESGCDAVR